MGYVKAGEKVLRVPLPEQMCDDIKLAANFNGIPMKAWIAMCLDKELATISDELNELKARRSKLKPPITS
jgi:hypothetical protein